jgi:hypothetical protein
LGHSQGRNYTFGHLILAFTRCCNIYGCSRLLFTYILPEGKGETLFPGEIMGGRLTDTLFSSTNPIHLSILFAGEIRELVGGNQTGSVLFCFLRLSRDLEEMTSCARGFFLLLLKTVISIPRASVQLPRRRCRLIFFSLFRLTSIEDYRVGGVVV